MVNSKHGRANIMSFHYKGIFGETEPTSVAAMINRTLNARERDDAIDDGFCASLGDRLAEHLGRTTPLREWADSGEQIDPEELERAIRPIVEFVSKMRHGGTGATSTELPRAGTAPVDNPNPPDEWRDFYRKQGSGGRGDYLDRSLQSRIPEGMSGVVVSHFPRR
jgi:hypothetical protein